MTLDDVPPGQQPTRITPAATSGGIGMMRVSNTAKKGMMRNWPSKPSAKSKRHLTTTRKSTIDKGRPIPNMMIARSVTSQGLNCLKVSGKKKPRNAKRITQAANVLPTKAETDASAFTCLLQRRTGGGLTFMTFLSGRVQIHLLGRNHDGPDWLIIYA